jgi:hypothetical protein
MIANPDRLVGRGGSPLYQAIKCQFIGAQLYVVAVLHVRCETCLAVHRLPCDLLLFQGIAGVLRTILADPACESLLGADVEGVLRHLMLVVPSWINIHDPHLARFGIQPGYK